jgi:hypothetical protein
MEALIRLSAADEFIKPTSSIKSTLDELRVKMQAHLFTQLSIQSTERLHGT